MFQYAFGLSLSKKLNSALYVDTTWFKQANHHLALRNYELDIFTEQISIANSTLTDRFLKPGSLQKALNKTGILRYSIYRESSLIYNNNIFRIKPPAYFEGFWQSEKYFNKTLVKDSFTFNKSFNSESGKIAGEIAKCPNPVSIHIRRGDYISSNATNQLHGACSITYYQNAIKQITDSINNPYFYIFSDDPDWVEQNLLPGLNNATPVSHNMGKNSWQDMALMSTCKHHIIANSSFSWWGAWLNPHPEKIVIAPQNWFAQKTAYFDDKDIVPENWLKISND